MNIKIPHLEKYAHEVSQLILDISYRAKVGHIGSALSVSDILTILYFHRMNISKKIIKSPSRDRFILSKGHAAAAFYCVMYKKGLMVKNELFTFGNDKGGLCEHPVMNDSGVDMTTGSLGHGLSFGIGLAYALKAAKIYRYSDRSSCPEVNVLISDGECNEGSTWEAALIASRFNLDNLNVIVDYNGWQCFGRTNRVTPLEPFAAKWKSFGWSVDYTDGHNIKEMVKTFNKLPFKKGKPNLIIAKTAISKGISFMEDRLIAHYKILSDEEYQIAKSDIKNRYYSL